jgi:hypothetical protein
MHCNKYGTKAIKLQLLKLVNIPKSYDDMFHFKLVLIHIILLHYTLLA